MHELDDSALLREYAGTQSEAAFAELVARHINKVYSVALRHTRNLHQAEEITQAVFVILARKAGQLTRHAALSGWLYETARLTAVAFIRSEIRRARREQEVLMQTFPNENESEVWPHIAPLLDDALAGLGEKDRHAVVLRFFDGKSMGEVGAALGGSEDAAKMRVSRAVEKLRKFFAKRGVVLSVTAIAGAVSANSVQAAPAGLAKTISVVAVAKGVAASTSTLTLVKGALNLMAWTKAKTAMIAGTCILLAAGTATVVIEHQNDGMAVVLGSMINQGLAEISAFPTLTNNVPMNGDLRIRSLMAWAQNDYADHPGKSTQEVSYNAVLGSGEAFSGHGELDMGRPYLIHDGNRSALLSIIARPNYPTTTIAFMVVTYKQGEELFDRRITLQWFAKKNEWGLLKESGIPYNYIFDSGADEHPK